MTAQACWYHSMRRHSTPQMQLTGVRAKPTSCRGSAWGWCIRCASWVKIPWTYCMTIPNRMMSHRCLSIGHCAQAIVQMQTARQSSPCCRTGKRRAAAGYNPRPLPRLSNIRKAIVFGLHWARLALPSYSLRILSSFP